MKASDFRISQTGDAQYDIDRRKWRYDFNVRYLPDNLSWNFTVLEKDAPSEAVRDANAKNQTKSLVAALSAAVAAW